MSNYQFNNAKEISEEFKKNSGNSRNSYEKENKKKEDNAMLLTFAWMKKVYWLCRDPGYLADKYPKRSKIDQKDWLISKS